MKDTVERPGPNEPCWCGSGSKYKKCHRDADEGGGNAPRTGLKRMRPGRISPMRAVPPHIPRPEYAEGGRPSRGGGKLVMSGEELKRMRRACRAAAEVLQEVGAAVRVGVTTDQLDAICHEAYLRRGGYPSTLNYHGYPKSLCTSVNEVICHGIPDDRPLEDGDIVNLDVTIYVGGMHGDCSATFLVGDVAPEHRRLVTVAEQCMWTGIKQVRPGRPVRDIGRAIEHHAAREGMGTVRAFCGHGIGERFHNDLQIPHFDDPDAKTVMKPGMVFTVEPMITLGGIRHQEWEDGWTAVTMDGKWTAQFEHTVLVTDTGFEVLTTVE